MKQKEEAKKICYLCEEREAVGKFLGQWFCRECVANIQIDESTARMEMDEAICL